MGCHVFERVNNRREKRRSCKRDSPGSGTAGTPAARRGGTRWPYPTTLNIEDDSEFAMHSSFTSSVSCRCRNKNTLVPTGGDLKTGFWEMRESPSIRTTLLQTIVSFGEWLLAADIEATQMHMIFRHMPLHVVTAGCSHVGPVTTAQCQFSRQTLVAEYCVVHTTWAHGSRQPLGDVAYSFIPKHYGTAT